MPTRHEQVMTAFRKWKYYARSQKEINENEKIAKECFEAGYRTLLEQADVTKAVQQLAESAPYDAEKAHMAADNLLMCLLDRLGYSELVNIYARMLKWYS